MSDVRIPYRAVGFLAQTGRAVARHGVRRGIGQAAAKVAPPLLLIEAAVSVVGAIGSFLDLAAARERRDALRQLNPLLQEQLRASRKVLEGEIAIAREELAQVGRSREIIARLVHSCRQAFSLAMRACRDLVVSDVPDLDAIERSQEALELAWRDVRSALQAYQAT